MTNKKYKPHGKDRRIEKKKHRISNISKFGIRIGLVAALAFSPMQKREAGAVSGDIGYDHS